MKAGKEDEDRLLGMDRPISRRDFLQGIALAAAAAPLLRGARGAGQPPFPSRLDPPRASGLRGQDLVSTRLGHRLREGDSAATPVDTGESYDLVVVGAGLSGLAGAHVYLRERKNARILLLDNHDDFGGHARRNTFDWNGVTLVAPGGTFALEEPEASPREARTIFESIGLDPDRLPSFRDPGFAERFGLSKAVFFDPRLHPGARPTWVNRFYDVRYPEFFARSPLSEEARRQLVELYTTRKDYLAGIAHPEAALAAMSWESFIRETMGLGDEAVRFANLYATDLLGLGCDAVSALAGREIGPGFAGMGGEGFYEKDGILRYAYEPVHRYPDGNHTIARHLLKCILPEAVPGPATMEGVFESQVRYDRLDRPGNPVRLRLRSLAVRVEHERAPGAGRRVLVDYVQPDGGSFRVTARGAIVAAWGMVAKHIVPEIAPEQARALEEYGYCSAVYANVLLRHWRPIAEVGAYDMYLPGGYCTWMHVSDPLRLGGYRPEYHPDRPTVLSMYKYLHRPGLPPDDQMRLGRYEMETKSFAAYEREIRAELLHVLGPWGFDPAEDILALTVNRWGHGYNFFHAPAGRSRKTDPPYERGRLRVGRISFAGADAGGTPWTQAALAQAYRAAQEQLAL